ncbi:MAG: T9SS type A sorting domain-containing protein [Bacteroidia bacterium]
MKVASTILLLLVLGAPAWGQWTANPAVNTPVCTATGKQIDLRMEGDGHGGTIITWMDYRSTAPDVYAQRLDRTGLAKWTANGVGICTHVADQGNAAIVTDMAGGAIITWSDMRSGVNWDIHAQRVDSNGAVKWTSNGVGIATKTEREDNEKIISDGAGGAIIVWEQERPSNQTWDIWAQRVNANGQVLWTSCGVAVVSDASNRINPKVQSDNHGGAYIVWQDGRSGVDFDIYGQHLNASGNRLWGATGKAIAAIVGSQTNPKIDPDDHSGGIYVAWTDTRLNNPGTDIYAARIDSNGNAFWAANGVAVSTALNSQSALDIVSDPIISGLIVTWKDNRGGSYDIYAQKITELGAPSWTPNGIAICTASGDQLNPNITADMAGGAIIVWQDSSGSDWSIRSQRVSGTGVTIWSPNGEWVGTASGDQTSPKNIGDDQGGSIYAFQDKRSGTNDIYAHHLNADGSPLLAVNSPVAGPSIEAWPNPFSDRIHLQLGSDGSPKTITVRDITGRLVLQMENVDLDVVLDGATFSEAGVYSIEVVDASHTANLKVVRIKQ